MTKKEDAIKATRLLIEGCAIHPSYRAKKAPRTECRDCAAVWKAALTVMSYADEKKFRRPNTIEANPNPAVEAR